MLSKEQGEFLVRYVREVITNFVQGEIIPLPDSYPAELDKRRGVFVTLEKFPSGDLRGCIGFPYPEKPLINAVKDAACSASRDSRFPPLGEEELDRITVEVSVLTEPEKVDFEGPEELLEKIKPEADGLILKKGVYVGIFLPQVWEKLPDKEQFLENLCYKAGLQDTEAWKTADIYKFQVQIFKEREPNGEIK